MPLKIAFSPNAAKEISHINMATREPLAFCGNEVTQVVWYVRLSPKGLMFVKLAIFLKCELTLQPYEVCVLPGVATSGA